MQDISVNFNENDNITLTLTSGQQVTKDYLQFATWLSSLSIIPTEYINNANIISFRFILLSNKIKINVIVGKKYIKKYKALLIELNKLYLQSQYTLNSDLNNRLYNKVKYYKKSIQTALNKSYIVALYSVIGVKKVHFINNKVIIKKQDDDINNLIDNIYK